MHALRNLILAIGLTISPGFAETTTVVAFGDSLTAGFGLPTADGFVPQLQAWLQDQGADAAVVNAGVSGDTTQGGLARIAWSLSDDTDVLIVALGGNDMLRGIDPALVRSNLSGILQAAASNTLPVLLIGIDASANFGPNYKADFDAIFPELASEYGTLHVQNFLGALLALPDRDVAFNTYMQADRIHPNAEGVALIVEDIGPSVLDLIERSR